jgi:hypothetical protein
VGISTITLRSSVRSHWRSRKQTGWRLKRSLQKTKRRAVEIPEEEEQEEFTRQILKCNQHFTAREQGTGER